MMVGYCMILCLVPALHETIQKFTVVSKPHYSRTFCHPEKQMIASETVSSAVYFNTWYAVKQYGLSDFIQPRI